MLIIDRISIEERPGDMCELSLEDWYYTVPAIRQIYTDGLTLTNPLTVIVGDNGVGKSTFLEAIAENVALPDTGGKKSTTKIKYSTSLSHHLRVHFSVQGLAAFTRKNRLGGFFYRSDTFFNITQNLDYRKIVSGDTLSGLYNHLSHGQSCLAALKDVTNKPGIYLLDEPEAGLSFDSTLQLMVLLKDLAESNNSEHPIQIICVTHSPLLAAIPGAQLLEFTSTGVTPTVWDDLTIVEQLRRFLNHPNSFLRHLF